MLDNRVISRQFGRRKLNFYSICTEWESFSGSWWVWSGWVGSYQSSLNYYKVWFRMIALIRVRSESISCPGIVVKKVRHTSSEQKLKWNELWIWKANEKDGKDLSFRKRSFSKLSMRSPNTKLIPSVNTKTFVNLENSPKRPLTDSNVVIRVLWASHIFSVHCALWFSAKNQIWSENPPGNLTKDPWLKPLWMMTI